MLYLIVAEPRTGKSQLAVATGYKHKKEGKRVFVTNLNQTPEQLEESGFERFDDATKWFDEMPHGAVWIIDEGQEIMPQRGKDKPLPEWIKQLSLHGHHDLTIYVITQDAMQLDVHLRRNCNFTWLLTRPLGRSKANVYTYRGYQERPNDAWRKSQVFKTAESVEKFKYSEKWQRLYTSASAHDHIKVRWPKKLLLFPVLVLIVCGLLWFAWSRLMGQAEDDKGTTSALAAALTGADAPSGGGGSPNALTLGQYVELHTPRIADIPVSAPLYDGFTPQDYPRLFCYESTRFEMCRCVTQQGSKAQVSQVTCKLIAENGYFDPYKKPESSRASSDSVGKPESEQSVVADAGESADGGQFGSFPSYGGIGVGVSAANGNAPRSSPTN